MPSIMHYRWEDSKRAICGARVQGHRARLWRRDWCVVPHPLSKERVVQLYEEGHRAIPCPMCLAKIAEQRAASEQKAVERPPKGFRYWDPKAEDEALERHGRVHEDGWGGAEHAGDGSP